MQNHSNLAEKNTRVIALRVPNKTYLMLLKRSEDWEMSVSSLIREMVIKIFNDDEEIHTIKSYKKRGNNDDGSTSH